MILDRLLKKLNVSSYLDLNEEERATYRAWEGALAGRKITDADVAAFLQAELDDTIAKIPTADLGKRNDTFLKVKLDFLLKVRAFLDAPTQERKAAEAALARQLETLPT